MPDKYRDEPRGERLRNRDNDLRREGGEHRSFGEEGRYSSDQARYYGADHRNYADLGRSDPAAGERAPWRRERYGSGRGEDRGVYGSGYDAHGGYGRDEEHGYRSFDGDVHGGQEYGVPAGGRSRLPHRAPIENSGQDLGYESRGQRRPYSDAAYGDQPVPHDAGSQQFGTPADYAYHPDPQQELHADYVNWRNDQLRGHDRDYAQWRAEQHRKYDEDYQAFQGERRAHFGKSFAEWRSQREQEAVETPETPDDKV